MTTRDLAVLVVTWNVRDLVMTALKTLLDDLAGSGLDATVHLVDCASADGTAAAVATAFPQIDLVASPDNLGFAGGNNFLLKRIGFDGAHAAESLPRAVYLLNPDTATQPGATKALYDALMADTRRGFVGARLSYGDGQFQHGAFGFPGLRQLWVEFFPTPGRLIEGRFNGRYPRHLYDAGRPFPVDCVLGAAMMIRREAILATGLFDEQFFMYCEEIDWAWRFHKAGFSGASVPAASVVHFAGQSTGQVRPRSILNLCTRRLRLYRKHYPVWKQQVARWMIARGMDRLARRAPEAEVVAAYQHIRDMARKAG
ncbi:MAG: glycosyltransferase family 2 protein [Chloroflexi bacterium]|nr:glycosyltransferase family 2 protein [Chloroflexota bacterium]